MKTLATSLFLILASVAWGQNCEYYGLCNQGCGACHLAPFIGKSCGVDGYCKDCSENCEQLQAVPTEENSKRKQWMITRLTNPTFLNRQGEMMRMVYENLGITSPRPTQTARRTMGLPPGHPSIAIISKNCLSKNSLLATLTTVR